MPSRPPPIMYVTYEGTSGSRFDRHYYVEKHLPLVMRAWQRHGLESATAFFPSDTEAGTLVICECRFRDEAAIEAALGSPQTPQVMADIAAFTELAPKRMRLTSV
ncbi:EthD family reductase [Frateuria aurantia]